MSTLVNGNNTEFVEASCRNNTVIDAYTTAQVRLKLYIFLQPLGRLVLYCDTDYVVFTTATGQWDPPLGDFFGNLTVETLKIFITHFVTGGRKTYAYLI